MIKKTVYFSNAVNLRVQSSQLCISFKNDSNSKNPDKIIPIEDIGLIIIDHERISITPQLVNALIKNNASILWCDEFHMPNGLVLPMAAHHTFSEKLNHQVSASLPLKKQLWKQTVRQKIKNQAAILKSLGFDNQNMLYWADQTSSGDLKNMEGRAAAYYWPLIFIAMGLSGATRHRYGPPPNHMLNYGYAILRAVVARSLIGSGCMPALGIHHHNKYNAFCLADDIMEPYRPIVDRLVIEWVNKNRTIPEELTKEMRWHLLNIPRIDVTIEKQKSPLMVGMQRTTASLMACFEGSQKKINYPEV